MTTQFICIYIYYMYVYTCLWTHTYPYLTAFTKINSGWIKELNAKIKQTKTTKVLGDTIENVMVTIL